MENGAKSQPLGPLGEGMPSRGEPGQRAPVVEAGKLPATWPGEDDQRGTAGRVHTWGAPARPVGNHDVHFMT